MKYRIFMITDEKIAILKDENDQIYKCLPPYEICEKINYGQYFNEVYSKNRGTVYPESYSPFKSLDRILRDLLNKEKEKNSKEKRKIIYEFLTWLLEDQDAKICQTIPQLHHELYPVTTWKTHAPVFFTEKYIKKESIKKALGRRGKYEDN